MDLNVAKQYLSYARYALDNTQFLNQGSFLQIADRVTFVMQAVLPLYAIAHVQELRPSGNILYAVSIGGATFALTSVMRNMFPYLAEKRQRLLRLCDDIQVIFDTKGYVDQIAQLAWTAVFGNVVQQTAPVAAGAVVQDRLRDHVAVRTGHAVMQLTVNAMRCVCSARPYVVQSVTQTTTTVQNMTRGTVQRMLQDAPSPLAQRPIITAPTENALVVYQGDTRYQDVQEDMFSYCVRPIVYSSKQVIDRMTEQDTLLLITALVFWGSVYNMLSAKNLHLHSL